MLDGKVCIVTGATSGIGLETARGLCRAGATVGLVGRSREKGERAIAELSPNARVRPVFFEADLSEMEQVRQLAGEISGRFDRLDVLINNAGVIMGKRRLTSDGLEVTLATNHFSHFLLTGLLLNLLKASAPARIVNVSSDAHRFAKLDLNDLQSEKRFTAFGVYGRSKLANLYFTFELARRLAGSGVTVNALHPGLVASNFSKNTGGLATAAMTLLRPFMISSEKGAETSLYLATAPELGGVTGRYYHFKKEHHLSHEARNAEAAAGLWDASETLTGFPYDAALLPTGLARPAGANPS